MASRFAEELVDRMRVQSSYPASVSAVDKRLSEVREVLDGLQTSVSMIDDLTVPHWCDPNSGECNVECERARALYEKLLVK